MGREAQLTAAIGMKGVGKTYKTWRRILYYVRGDVSKGLEPRKWLIVDVNDEFGPNDEGFPPVKAIPLSEVHRFARQPRADVKRIRMFKSNGQKMTLDEILQTLFYVLDQFQNGGILIEDISKYVSDVIPKDVIGAICTQRHVDCDVILHFQLIGKILHPKIWGNLNLVRLHKYKGSVTRYKNEFEGSYELMLLAETLIAIQHDRGNKYFHCYANLDYDVITGDFTSDDFMEAINIYIQRNYRSVVNPVLQERDTKGNLIHTPETVINTIRDKLFAEYYGNE